MASTYSPALRLELMATGDQSGTWGDTTNTNLGTLLEQAVTGYLSVAQGDVANLTLTTVNGGSDQARNAVIRVTGALTATRNVVIQTAAKLYTIANDTTGGFSIVVKTSAGTGVSVPPGAMMNIYSDGTNAVMGQNYWSGSIGGAVYLDAGAAVGPSYDLFRDSTSPAASDLLGQVIFNGRDSAGNKQEYGELVVRIDDATATSEDGSMVLKVVKAGTVTSYLALGQNAAGTATADAIGLPLGQLSFPATQNASSDANTLDDYQENASSTTWAFATPGTSSWAYAGANTVNYTKVGDFVFIDLDLSATPTIGTGSGTLTITITGFPYTPAAITPLTISTMNLSWVWPASRTQVAAFMQTDGAIVVTGLGTGVSQSLFAASNMTSGSAHLLRMAGCVKVS